MSYKCLHTVAGAQLGGGGDSSEGGGGDVACHRSSSGCSIKCTNWGKSLSLNGFRFLSPWPPHTHTRTQTQTHTFILTYHK